mmetsp:Transcript_39860/g.97716  ORF Transcript_39860/g.97716 Transcript_39860/m.97716 type:complete len:377 (-) Transcript_39860:407-1537(-)
MRWWLMAPARDTLLITNGCVASLGDTRMSHVPFSWPVSSFSASPLEMSPWNTCAALFFFGLYAAVSSTFLKMEWSAFFVTSSGPNQLRKWPNFSMSTTSASEPGWRDFSAMSARTQRTPGSASSVSGSERNLSSSVMNLSQPTSSGTSPSLAKCVFQKRRPSTSPTIDSSMRFSMIGSSSSNVGRTSGSPSQQRMHTCAMLAGMLAGSFGRTFLAQIALRKSLKLVNCEYGSSHEKSSQMHKPKLYTSALPSICLPSITSGAIHSGVPGMSSSSSHILPRSTAVLRPKSQILTFQSLSMSRLAGLRSRWRMHGLRVCSQFMPRAVCLPIDSLLSSVTLAFGLRMSSLTLPSGMSSVNIAMWPRLKHAPMNSTTFGW